MTTKKYGPPSPAEFVAAYLAERGVQVDPLRLEERVAAVRSRQQIEHKQDMAHAREVGTAVKKARRSLELAQWAWRRDPSPKLLSEVQAAKQMLSAARAELLDEVAQDEDLAARLSR